MYIRRGIRLKPFHKFFCGQKFYPDHGPRGGWMDTALQLILVHERVSSIYDATPHMKLGVYLPPSICSHSMLYLLSSFM